MIRERLGRYLSQARQELRKAFREEHSSHEVAASFAIGIFFTALPTGGAAIGLFFLFVYWWSWISKTAIFAAVLVLNPIVKPAVYVSSYQVGTLVLGSESIVLTENIWINEGARVIQLLLFGNLLVALVLSGLAYVVVFHLSRVHRRNKRERRDRQSVI